MMFWCYLLIAQNCIHPQEVTMSRLTITLEDSLYRALQETDLVVS